MECTLFIKPAATKSDVYVNEDMRAALIDCVENFEPTWRRRPLNCNETKAFLLSDRSIWSNAAPGWNGCQECLLSGVKGGYVGTECNTRRGQEKFNIVYQYQPFIFDP